MAPGWLAIAMVAAVACGALAGVLWRLSSTARVVPPSRDWVERFDARRYRPALRLMKPDDLEFLEREPGYSAEIGRRLRAARRRALVGYLKWMKADFDRLYVAGKLMVAEADSDRSDFALVLVRVRGRFLVAYAKARLRLALGWAGAPNVQALTEALEDIRFALRISAPADAAA